jgi:hypothetical protein
VREVREGGIEEGRAGQGGEEGEGQRAREAGRGGREGGLVGGRQGGREGGREHRSVRRMNTILEKRMNIFL